VSATYAAQGINLRHHALGEADRIISIFTREHGLVRAVAKGIKKTTNRFGGRMEPLCCNDLQLRQGRSMELVISADTVRSFGGLRHDFDRLAFGIYLADVLNSMLPPAHPQPVVYDLFVSTLAMLETLERPDLIAIWFQLQLLTELGHHLLLDSCHACQRPIDLPGAATGFDLAIGALVCGACRWGRPTVRDIAAEPVRLLRRLRDGGVTALAETPEPLSVALSTQRLLGEHFATITEREIKSLRILLDQAAV
jgi:DNA repair protein RecO (recombination protein O)